MKRIMGIIISVSMLMVMLTGCTKPVEAYKVNVKDAGIDQMVVEMVDLVEALKQKTAEVDASEFDVDFDSQEAFLDNLGLEDVEEIATNLQVKINEIKEAIDNTEMDLEDEEVADLHQPLLNTIEAYDEMASVIEKSSVAVETVMVESYKVYTMAMEMNSLIMANYMSMSPGFMDAFLANQEALNEAMNVLGTDEFTNMMDSGNVDTALIDTTTSQMQGVVLLINSYEAENEADTAIRDFLLDLVNGVVNMLQVLKEGADTFALTADYEDMTDYLMSVTDDGSKVIDNWLDEVE